MLRFILCDDDKGQLNFLIENITKIINEKQINGEVIAAYTNPIHLLNHFIPSIKENINVYILDIDLKNGLNGLQLAQKIRQFDSLGYIIFSTAHSEYTFPSFKVKTFDYLIKPINIKFLERTLVSLFRDYMNFISMEDKDFIKIKSGNNIYNINPNDILYIEKDKRLMYINTISNVYSCYETLDNILKLLDDNFCRSHKSFIVNKKHIEQIDFTNNIIYFYNGKSCYLSRKYKSLFKVYDKKK